MIKAAIYDVQQRVFFYSNEMRKYWQYFNLKVPHSDNMIQKLIGRFERTESIGDLPGRSPERSVSLGYIAHSDTKYFFKIHYLYRNALLVSPLQL